MNNKQAKFLLKYAKIGILNSMERLDVIESEELKQEYIQIKKELTNTEEITPTIRTNTTKTGEKKEGAVKKWFSGIGDRQRKYKEDHKGDIM